LSSDTHDAADHQLGEVVFSAAHRYRQLLVFGVGRKNERQASKGEQEAH
jgi:hypothetical protein